MSDDSIPPKTLGEVLGPPPLPWMIDLLPAIRRLEFGQNGTKVTRHTRTEHIENADGSISTFDIKYKEVRFLRNPQSGPRANDFILRYPERMEIEEWTKYFQAVAAQAAREREKEIDFMDED